MPCICTKFHEEILNGLKIIKRTRNIARHKQRGIKTSDLKVGLWFFFSAHRLIVHCIFTKFHEEILNGLKLWSGHEILTCEP